MEPVVMSEEDVASLGVSEGDISSTDVSEFEERTAKETASPGSVPELGEAPTLLSGYSQTYIVQKQCPRRDQAGNRQVRERGIFNAYAARQRWVLRDYGAYASRETSVGADQVHVYNDSRMKLVRTRWENYGFKVLFRCGNWCYTGEVSFAGLGDGQAITLRDIPRAVPMLQRQQDRLKFFCCADRVPLDSVYREPVEILEAAQEFVAQELASPRTTQDLTRWSGAFHWIDDDSSASTYFELQADLPPCMEGIALVACKTYARGLVFITVNQGGSFYVVMQEGEGDQALLDVRFPDVSQHGQGLHLMSYGDRRQPWRKLTLWHTVKPSPANQKQEVVNGSTVNPSRSVARRQTTNLTSTTYTQTYVIMKPTGTATFGTSDAYRDVLFRFGSWCYSGTVQLTSTLALADIPHVIPALRMQQSKLDFMCDVSQIPSKSPFAAPLACMQRLMPLMEDQVATSEEVLTDLMEKLSDMGLEDSVSTWFDGDSSQSFFEFQTSPTVETRETFRGVDLVATKLYSACGVVTIAFWFEDAYYVVLGEGGEEQPLLDSRFPNVSAKGRGYQIRAMSEGLEGWEDLRKVSVWQTVAALEKETEAKMNKQAGGREKGDVVNNREHKSVSSLVRTIEMASREKSAGAAGDGILVVGGARAAAAGGIGGDNGASGGGFTGASNDLMTEGGSSVQAEPKDAGSGNSSLGGFSIVGTAGTNRGDGDRVEGGTGSKDVKQRGEAGPSEAGSKHDSRVPMSGVPLSPVAAGVKAEPAPQHHHAAAKALTTTKVALPHHLTPMAGLEEKMNKMRMDMRNESGDAPWDSFGRPRTAHFGAKAHK